MPIIELLKNPPARVGRLTLLIVLVAVTLAHQVVLFAVGHPFDGHELSWLHLAASLPAGLIGWSVAVKRAHDLGKSAWWLLLLSAIYVALIAFLALGGMTTIVAPLFGVDPQLLAGVKGMFSPGMRLRLAVTVASIALFWPVLIRLLFYAGTPGANRFGPPPQLLADLTGEQPRVAGAVAQVAGRSGLPPRATVVRDAAPRARHLGATPPAGGFSRRPR